MPSSSTDTTSRYNQFGQPIGPEVVGWIGCQRPLRTSIQGHYCDVVPLIPEEHANDLFNAFANDIGGANWTYLFAEPFSELASFQQWLLESCTDNDPLFYTIIDRASQKAVGMASLMRIDPVHGVIEVGNIHFSPLLQKTPLATEAMFLLMRRVFDELGYRRYEWKCDNHNAPSKRAAKRFGFTFEGIFRQAVVYKGRSRDTAWFSIIDSDWPVLKEAYQTWLSPDNFDQDGQQYRRLAECYPAK